MAFFSLLIITV